MLSHSTHIQFGELLTARNSGNPLGLPGHIKWYNTDPALSREVSSVRVVYERLSTFGAMGQWRRAAHANSVHNHGPLANDMVDDQLL